MKRFKILSLLLAAALQVLPYCRTIVLSPAANSAFAVILRWAVGGAAALGTYDAVSGASLPVIFTNPTNFQGIVGVFFTNNVAITNNKTDPGAFFILTNSTANSGPIIGGASTTVCMPPGLTFKCYDLANGNNPRIIYGAMFGTPTTAITNYKLHLSAQFSGTPSSETNIFFTFAAASGGQSPVITNQPVSITNVVGSNAIFSVVAGGTIPLMYQWRFGATNIQNATNTSLILTNIQTTNAGSYFVVITNVAGSITSAPATLTVLAPPVIAVGPKSRAAVPNGSASFSVTATGTNLVYQWQFNSTNLVNQTNASYNVVQVQPGAFGPYRVIITNFDGATTSSVANLTLAVPPTLSAGPLNLTTFFYTFPTEYGPIYAVEFKTNLTDPGWTELTRLNGDGNPQMLNDNSVTNVSRFYRVHLY